MPNRLVREAWVESEAVDKLTAEAERFFLRLCLKADDFGRFHGHTQLLKSHLFPLRETLRSTDITAWLAECEATGVVRCYEVARKRYVVIPKFRQRTRAQVSKFPPPPPPTDDRHTPADGGHTSAGARLDGGGDGDGGGDEGAGADGTARVRLHGIPASVEEVIAYGQTLNPPVTEARAREFWSHYEGQAKTNPDGALFWVTSGDTVITNWKAKLPQFGLRNETARGAGKPNPRNAGTYGDPAEQGRRIADKIARQTKERTHD